MVAISRGEGSTRAFKFRLILELWNDSNTMHVLMVTVAIVVTINESSNC